jgi:histidinol-phosphate/aromatic aminotransferase/cobyric acid decarboxylase-like protein
LAPHDAAEVAARLDEREILARPRDDARLGQGFVRATTSAPEDDAQSRAAIDPHQVPRPRTQG